MIPVSNEQRATSLPYRADIDGLRGIAILCVVGFHAFPDWIRGGFIGVDIFFVISGFLIGGITLQALERGNFSYATFYARRIRRIFPALILVLLASYIVGYLFLIGDDFRQLGKHITAGAVFLSNFVLWNESGYFDTEAATKPLLHLWSLGIEEQFYLFWPPMLVLSIKRKRNILDIIVFFAIVSFFSNVFIIGTHPAAAFYSPLTRLWELMMGCMLAYHGCYRPEHFNKNRKLPIDLTGVGLLLVAMSVALLDTNISFPGWWALLPTAGALLIISAGPDARLNRTLLSNVWLVRIGLISYPLYLWHWPLLSFGQIILNRPPPSFIRACLIAMSFVLAVCTYALERQVRFRMPSANVTAVLCLLMLCCGYLGVTLSKNTGLVDRLVPIIPAGRSGAYPDESCTGRNIVPCRMRYDAYSIALKQYSKILRHEPQYMNRLINERLKNIRNGHCHLSWVNPSFPDYLSKAGPCLNLSTENKNVLIIGDSHAADLYVALSRTHKEYNFLQATGDLCLPANLPRTHDKCTQLVQYALNFSKDNKLDAVIIEAAWFLYDGFDKPLASIIQRLKDTGQKVVLVGPPLRYSADVDKIIARRMVDAGFGQYIASFIDYSAVVQSRKMRMFAHAMGIFYIDRISYFCKTGCPVLDSTGQLLLLDRAHLTSGGAVYLGDQLLHEQVLKRIIDSRVPLYLP